jgi:hypothetical protein
MKKSAAAEGQSVELRRNAGKEPGELTASSGESRDANRHADATAPRVDAPRSEVLQSQQVDTPIDGRKPIPLGVALTGAGFLLILIVTALVVLL